MAIGTSTSVSTQCRWDNCTVTTDSKEALREHMKTHYTKDGDTCLWRGCTTVGAFANPSRMRTHVKNIHVDPKEVKCDQCPKTFTNISRLKVHYTSHKKAALNLTCKQCAVVFTESRMLTAHNQNCPNPTDEFNKAPLKCMVCRVTFVKASTLKVHNKCTMHLNNVAIRAKKSLPQPAE